MPRLNHSVPVELTELTEVPPTEELHIERMRRGLKVGVKVQRVSLGLGFPHVQGLSGV